MDNENGTTKYKLSVEGRLSVVETFVNEIRTNHLPHIESKIDRISWLLVITLIGMVANLIVKLA